jgi:hypothetical protein
MTMTTTMKCVCAVWAKAIQLQQILPNEVGALNESVRGAKGEEVIITGGGRMNSQRSGTVAQRRNGTTRRTETAKIIRH